MKALRWHHKRDIRIDTVEMPDPTTEEALIKVEWCGICGSDLHEYTDGQLPTTIRSYTPFFG